MAFTTTELLASIKRRANIPTASGVFGDAELLSMATEELRSYIVPLVRKERDTDGDGRVDYWEYWEGDKIDRIGIDTNGDGRVDVWKRAQAAG